MLKNYKINKIWVEQIKNIVYNFPRKIQFFAKEYRYEIYRI
jgi:hypothetical protein